MKTFYRSFLLLFFVGTSLNSFSAALTWIGAGAGGAGTDFNAGANWNTGTAPTAADDLTMNLSSNATVLVTASITVNSITMTVTGSNVTGVLDAQTFTLQMNATSAFNATAGNLNTRGILHVGTVPGTIRFNGDVNFNLAGTALFKFRSSVATPGQFQFMANVTTGTNAFTEPGDEPQFNFNKSGAQSWTFNSAANYIVPESIIIGQGNISVTSFLGAGTAGLMNVYNGGLTVSAGCTLDIGKFACDKLTGVGAINLGANSLLRIGSTNDFPTGYTVYTIDIASTVEFYGAGATQNIGAMPGVDNYGNLSLIGGGSKQQTSLGGIQVRGTMTIGAGTTYWAWNELTTVLGTMTNNGTYDASDNVQTFRGNFVQNGTWTQLATVNSIAQFTGTAAQTLSGTAVNTAFRRMTVNNTSATGVIVNLPLDIITNLVLTDGVIYTNATNTFNLRAGCASGQGSVASHVDGPIRKTGNTAFVFPTGDNGVWARIATASNPALASDAFTAQYFDAPYGTLTPVAGPNAYVSSVEHWVLNRTVGTSNVSVRLYWENGTRSGINTFSSDLHISRFDGTTWQDHGSGVMTGSAALGTITTPAVVTSFSPFTFASITASTLINPLPVELVSFSAILSSKQVDIAWETASETNNDYFTIEKSKDGVNFEELMRVKGAGNSTQHLSYFDIDQSPWGGISYYRLKQTDFNGNFNYSSIVPVENNSGLDPGISIFPNPSAAGSITYIALTDLEGSEVLVVLRDLTGKEVYSKAVISSSRNEIVAIDPEGKLAKGSYLVTASSANNLYSKKLIIK